MSLDRVYDHWNESKVFFPEDYRMIAMCLQGSQNYNLDTSFSDVDTKLLLAPSLEEIALNKKRISTTHIRANQEHTDWKDVSLYFNTFRKQNLNFVEILFTPWYIVNDLYKKPWENLLTIREHIAHLNPYRAVKTMKGIALEKYHAMEHRYPSRAYYIDTYGYDGKQVSHLVRVHEFLMNYVGGVKYENCLRPTVYRALILDCKNNMFGLEEARHIAQEHLNAVVELADKFCAEHEDEENQETSDVMDNILFEIIKIAMKEQLK